MARKFHILLLVSVVSCGDPTSRQDPFTRAQDYRSNGQPELALTALREVMRSKPDDPEIRLLLAEIYLDLGQGALAGTAVEQALERGVEPTRVVLPSARALFMQQRWHEVLGFDASSVPDVGVRAQLMRLQADARAESSGSSGVDENEIVGAYIELFEFVDAHRSDAEVADVRANLAAARSVQSNIDRAWQHYDCRFHTPETEAWGPTDRDNQRVLNVGPDRKIRTIAAAAAAARDGDIVEIDPGVYRGGVALWPQDDLIVRGASERPHITADGKSIEQRDVWLYTGNNIVVENVEISGARSPYENGAAIRHIGSGLVLRHVFLHNNENGLLTGNRYADSGATLIEHSEFGNNGDGKGLAHNIYIGRSSKFELRYSFSHGVKGGHLVKSRAAENVIAYNRLTDGVDGTSSYIIDLPEGGRASILGNVIEQGPATLNHGMFSFAGESIAHVENQLLVVNNSIYNRDFQGIVVRNHHNLDVVMRNNLLGGAPVAMARGSLDAVNNLTRPDHGMADPRNYDFRLTPGAHGIDSGVEFDTVPVKEYVHPAEWRRRSTVWRVDVGAHERCGI